jgi:hypothetical protein
LGHSATRNCGHLATRKCFHTQAGRNLNRNPKEAKVKGQYPYRRGQSSKKKKPRDLSGPGNYKEALKNINIAIFKKTYPEDNLNEED